MNVRSGLRHIERRFPTRPFLIAVFISLILSPLRCCYRVMTNEPNAVALLHRSPELKLAWASIAELGEALDQRKFSCEELINVSIITKQHRLPC